MSCYRTSCMAVCAFVYFSPSRGLGEVASRSLSYFFTIDLISIRARLLSLSLFLRFRHAMHSLALRRRCYNFITGDTSGFFSKQTNKK